MANAFYIEHEATGCKLTGWICQPTFARAQPDLQYFYLNGRMLRDRLAGSAIRMGYRDVLFHGRHPAYVLFLEIDPAQLGPYLVALREEVETSIRVEPGVLTLYSVQVKGAPWRVRLFEMYADSNAYNAHIASPHFQKYKTGTAAMVRSLVLLETDPVLLGTKPTDRLRAYVSVQ